MTVVAASLLQLLGQDCENIMDAAGSVLIIVAIAVTANRSGIVLVLAKKGILQCLFCSRIYRQPLSGSNRRKAFLTDSPV